MYDAASEEVLGTLKDLMTLNGRIVDVDCTNSKLHTELPCSNKCTGI